MPGSPVELRQAQTELSSLLGSDLSVFWNSVSDFDDARATLGGVLPDLVNTYGMMSASLAAEWYSDARELAKVTGTFRPMPARIENNSIDSLVSWSTGTGFNLENVFSLVSGGVQRRVLDWGRQTITSSSIADPKALGWQRFGAGGCDFCEMLISRGAVYTEAHADFAAHDDCHCQAGPAFGGKPRLVEKFKPSVRRSPADAKRAREWIATHRNEG